MEKTNMTDQNRTPATANEIDWTDESAGVSATSNNNRKLERFTAKGGVTYRMAMLTPKPIRTFQHYKKPYGYFSCLKPEGLECLACNAGEKLSEKYAVNVLLYPAGAEATTPWDPSQLHVMLWQFGPKVFSDIRDIVKEWGPVSNYDLKFTCTNEQFQHMTVTPCRESLWQINAYAAQIQQVIEQSQYDLPKIVLRKETVEEVRQIWTAGVTRDQVKAARDAAKGAPSPSAAPAGPFAGFTQPHAPQAPAAPAAPQVPAIPARTSAPAAVPDFSSLLRRSA
jgi:hypothetical protein